MDISVVIPTWNRSNLMPRAIGSVLNQSRRPTEVIVVDDGSEDDTAAKVIAEFPGVRLLSQAHRGVSAARNHGIKVAAGEWVALLDSDDEWLPEKLALQVAMLESQPDLRACHTDEIWIRNGRRVNPMQKHAKPAGWIFNQCLPRCCISPSSVILHYTVFEKVGLFDESLPACEDYDMWLRVFQRYPVGLIEKPLLIKYGGHADQLSRRHWGMDRFRVKALDKILSSGVLTQPQTQACAEMLKNKCDVLIGGCEKRGKHEEANHYRQLKSRWRRESGEC